MTKGSTESAAESVVADSAAATGRSAWSPQGGGQGRERHGAIAIAIAIPLCLPVRANTTALSPTEDSPSLRFTQVATAKLVAMNSAFDPSSSTAARCGLGMGMPRPWLAFTRWIPYGVSGSSVEPDRFRSGQAAWQSERREVSR